jgi:hypothetical protein
VPYWEASTFCFGTANAGKEGTEEDRYVEYEMTVHDLEDPGQATTPSDAA